MLSFNFTRIFQLKGISHPGPFLMKHGFKKTTAFRIAKNEAGTLVPSQIEKLCIILCCTPNDLMEWKPDSKHDVSENHPIRKLLPKETIDLRDIAHDIPVEKVNEFALKIEELKKSLLQE